MQKEEDWVISIYPYITFSFPVTGHGESSTSWRDNAPAACSCILAVPETLYDCTMYLTTSLYMVYVELLS